MSEWHARNRAYLDLHVERLRHLLGREADRLRAAWSDDPLRRESDVVSDEEADRHLGRGPPGGGRGKGRGAKPKKTDAPAGGSVTEADTKSPEAPLDAELERARRWFHEQGTTPTPERLAQRLGLDAVEHDVVLLCLAPHLDPSFGRLFAYVQDDARRTRPTPELATRLLAPGDGLDRFLPDHALRALRVVHVDGGPEPTTPLASHGLRLDERVVAFLLGDAATDPHLAVRPVPDGPRTPEHDALARRVADWLDAGHPVPVLDLRGAPGSGRRVLAHALAAHLRVRLHGLDADRLPAPGPERDETLRLLRRESLLARTAYLLDAGYDGPPADVVSCGALVLTATQNRWDAPPGTLRIDVPAPDAPAQADLWRAALADAGVSVDDDLAEALPRVAQQVHLSPSELPEAIAAAHRHADLEGRALDADALWVACRDRVGASLGDTAQRIHPTATRDDIVLPPDAAAQLDEIVAQVRGRTLVYDQWGFARPDARGRGISVLFSGASGTGKTMAAEVLAHELGLDLYRIDLASVVSKYVGETEKNLRRVFDTAERSGALLFFDEADALFTSRTEVRDSHDRYANLEVDYLLQRMESYRGLAVLATNRKSSLDPAFLRRLRFQVDFPFPDRDARRRIWERVFPGKLGDHLDAERLSLLELSGAGIRNTALNAAFLAAARTPPRITMEDVLHAARREYAKLDRTPDRTAFGAVVAGGAR